MGVRDDTRTVSVTEPITLGDLRWLVGQCGGMPEETPVGVSVQIPPDPRDGQPTTITVVSKPTPVSLRVHRTRAEAGKFDDGYDRAERRW